MAVPNIYWSETCYTYSCYGSFSSTWEFNNEVASFSSHPKCTYDYIVNKNFTITYRWSSLIFHLSKMCTCWRRHQFACLSWRTWRWVYCQRQRWSCSWLAMWWWWHLFLLSWFWCHWRRWRCSWLWLHWWWRWATWRGWSWFKIWRRTYRCLLLLLLNPWASWRIHVIWGWGSLLWRWGRWQRFTTPIHNITWRRGWWQVLIT